ncbi:MAG: tyrosine-type recombinase/integrase [Candidatus Omnitrophota bacterium]
MRTIPEVLTIEEQERLLSVFNVRYWTAHRNKVMVLVFLNAGLRLSEALNLRWTDINLQTGQLKVKQGKGQKDRILWLSDGTIKELQEWRARQTEKVNSEYVFSTREGRALYPRETREMIYTYSEKAGKRIKPHTLRHTFATDIYRETKNIRMTQKALGHSDLSTTMIYTHIVDSELEEAMKTFRK